MNIIGHLIVGTIQSVICGSFLPLLGSILPDVVLIPNEFNNRLKGQHFSDKKISMLVFILYMFTHSLLFVAIIYYFSPLLAFGILFHQLIDWFTHTNKFRTMPLFPILKQVGVEINNKKVLLLSGGYDSVAILEMIDRTEYDYWFIDYNQSYSKEERNAIAAVSKHYNIYIKILEKQNWYTDIKNRNFLMIAAMQELGYDTICIGSRNIIPLFDKYKDSNYASLKMFALLNRIVIETPLALMSKKQIKNTIPSALFHKLYSTEK